MIPALAYLRISSIGDVEGDGFPRQRQAIDKYALANGIEIVDEYRDEGVPGTTELKNRQGLAACLARIETNGVKLVLVEQADRLARDSMVAELIIREFQKVKARVITAQGGVDLTAGDDSNPTAKLVRQILAAVAEFDRCVIVLKTRAARERIRAAGKKCEGRKAYGTKPGEELVLATIQELRSKDQTNEEIASYLNQFSVPTRYGKRWHSGTVAKILARERMNHVEEIISLES